MHAHAGRFTLWLLLLAARAAAAGPATDQVKATVDQIVAVLEDPALAGPAHRDQRRARIREAVLRRFRFDEMAKRALGAEWSRHSAAEHAEFVDLFTELLERSYIHQIEGYQKGERITYDAENVDGDLAEVRSTITNPRDNEKTQIVYRLLRSGPTWQVYDLVVDGTSMVNNYRIEFARIIAGSGYAGLVSRMRSKLAERRATEGRLAPWKSEWMLQHVITCYSIHLPTTRTGR